jgi:hypothetical protein
MPRVVLGILAVVAATGWAIAFVYFTKSGDLDGELVKSEAARGELSETLELAQKDLEKHIESAGRLDEIGQQLSAAEDQVASLETQIGVKQDQLKAVTSNAEAGKAELATLESKLRERKAQASEIEQEIEQAGIERDRLIAQAEELERKAKGTQSEPLTDPPPEGQTASEAAPSTAALEETDRVEEARKRFQLVDQNDDRKIDEFEFRLGSIKLLTLIDANEDGFVTIEETLLSPEQFKVFDVDGDGKISPIEFVTLFPALDTNGRGFLTFEEYLTFVQSTAK